MLFRSAGRSVRRHLGGRAGAWPEGLQGTVLTVHVVRWSDAVEVPWRNGGGLTRELVVRGGAPFDWRLSAASIAVDGPFSEFPGVDRILMLLGGDGVRLWFSDDGSSETVERPGDFVEFAGERPAEATLLGGSTVDLNLMWRRDRFRASVQTDVGAPAVDVVIVHVRTGTCVVETEVGESIRQIGRAHV